MEHLLKKLPFLSIDILIYNIERQQKARTLLVKFRIQLHFMDSVLIINVLLSCHLMFIIVGRLYDLKWLSEAWRCLDDFIIIIIS